MTSVSQITLYENNGDFGTTVGISSQETTVRLLSTDTYDTKNKATQAGYRLIRSRVPSQQDIIVYEPEGLLSIDSSQYVEHRTNWSGATFSSIVDHFASFESGSWDPQFPLNYDETPEPPYDVYTDGTYTPAEDQDADRTLAGVGFVVAGSNDSIFCRGIPATVPTDSLESEYYAILSALETLDVLDGATVHTDHRNVTDVAYGEYPDRCSEITEDLERMFNSNSGLDITYVNRSETRLADGLATTGTRQPISLGTPPNN